MAGYSGTPLVKKLGIKDGFRVRLVNAPKGFTKELEPFPADAKILASPLTKPFDLIVLFADSQRTLKAEFPRLAKKLPPTAHCGLPGLKKPQA